MKLRNKLFTIVGTLGAVATPVAAVVSCGSSSNSSSSSSVNMDLSDNTFDVAMEASHAPLYYHISDDQYTKLIEKNTDVDLAQKLKDLSAKVSTGGYNIGYDIFVQNEIAKKLSASEGHPITTLIHPTPWKTIIPFLENKNNHIDSIIASMSVLEDRKKHVKFSNPYLNSKNGLIYRKNRISTSAGQVYPFYASAAEVFTSITNPNPVIGTFAGTIQEVILGQIRPLNFSVKLSATLDALIQDLRTNRAKAILIDETSKDYALGLLGSDYAFGGENDPRFQTKTQETYAAAMPLGVSSKYETQVNAAISSVDQAKMNEEMKIVSDFVKLNKIS